MMLNHPPVIKLHEINSFNFLLKFKLKWLNSKNIYLDHHVVK